MIVSSKVRNIRLLMAPILHVEIPLTPHFFPGPSDISTLKYYEELFQTVDDKHNAGFNTTITDYWGRALSYQLVDASNGGPGKS
jgi:hypothetical protein